MGTVHDELDAAITTLLDVDPHDLSDDDLSDAVVAIQRQTSRLAAAQARLISAWDHRHLWAADGSRTPGARLARDADIERIVFDGPDRGHRRVPQTSLHRGPPPGDRSP